MMPCSLYFYAVLIWKIQQIFVSLEISVSMRLSSPGVDPGFGKPVVFEQNVLVQPLN